MGSEAGAKQENCSGSGSLDLPQAWVSPPPLAPPRATSNTWVRETVALELSYVNSNLQLLKEELAELSSSVDVDQPEGWETPYTSYVWRVRLGGGSLRKGPQAAAMGNRSRAHVSGSSESVTIPMIPLGLKETKELDWATPLKVSVGL